MRTNVYVDGFNLYYGCLRDTPYRWLDLLALSRHLLPKHDIRRIRYFTARIHARPSDPQQPQRQDLYLRALVTIPVLTMEFGHFLSKQTRVALVNPPGATALAWRTDEKGSDVNLATSLLVDAFDDDFDVAVVVSNDSDLAGPVEIVRKRFSKAVGVLNPHSNTSRRLQQAATFYKPIRSGVLAASQFPATLTDSRGSFSKPPNW